jgi:hypothetical protein
MIRPLDRSLPNTGVVSWQSPRNRRSGLRVSPAAMIAFGCAVTGAAALCGQALGLLHWPGPALLIPAILVVAGGAAPLFLATRASLRWLGG